MKLIVNNSALVLNRLQTVELDDAAGATAIVDRGCIWITMENDQRDVVLGAGQSFTVARNGKTLLHAARPSAVHIVERTKRASLKTLWKTIRRATENWAVREIERPRPIPRY